MNRREVKRAPVLRFKGFTNDWEQRKLIEILKSSVTDGPHETPQILKKGVPFISVEAIVNNKIDFNRKRGYISFSYNAQCNKKYRPQKKDVLLVKSGSTVGKVAVVETNTIFNIWSPLAALRVTNSNDPYFLYYLLQTNTLQRQIINKSKGGTQPNLSMRILEQFKIFLPQNYLNQQKIEQLLRTLDKCISLQQRKLESFQFTYHEIIRRLFLKKAKWQQTKLSDLVTILDKNRKPVKKEDRLFGDTPYYGANGIQDYISGFTHKGEFILIAEDGANSLTEYPIYFVKGQIWVNNHAHVLKVNKDVSPLFLALALKQINYSKYTVGSSRNKLNLKDLENIAIFIPDNNEQQKIGQFYSNYLNYLRINKKRIQYMKQFKQFLLQNMFI
ncbi:MAG: restriction endonuclease subunit S [Lactobacillus gallinarum]|uniref:restriction endonuclease subunit S n=2 Tax=Lactobacillus TaxID=1578 RepID=UPI0037F17ABA